MTLPSWRAVFWAMIVIFSCSYITPYNDYDLANTFIAGNLLPTSSMVVLLLCVFFINPILRLFLSRFTLRSEELAVLWALVVIASGIPAAGLWRYIIPQLPNLLYRSSPANRWDELLIPYTPKWMIVSDKLVAKAFYEGNNGRILWDGWLTPLAFWMPFAFALFFAVLCLAALLRRQWMEREQFTFPLVQLPFELTRQPQRGKLLPPLIYQLPLWIGFSGSALLHLLCGLNTYFPTVPSIRRFRSLSEYLSGFPWDVISGTGLHIYPSAIGLTYLLTTEVSFSLWTFYLLERAQQILFAYYGWTGLGFSAGEFVQYQQVGSVIALLIIIIYAGRTHWRQVISEAMSLNKPFRIQNLQTADEPLPYTVAFWGLLAVTVGLFFGLVTLGLNPLLAATFLTMAYGFYIASSWIATNGGMVMVQMRILPFDPIIALFGTKGFSRRSIVMMCLLQEAFSYDLRETLMPSLLNAMKIGQLLRVRQQALMMWGYLGIFMSAFVSLYAWLKLGYTKGAVSLSKTATFSWHANFPYMTASQYISSPMPFSSFRTTGMIVGFLGFVGIYLMRLHFSAFPFHPVGWIVCRGWAMEQFWLMIFLGWLAKTTIVHYSGLSGYKAMRPFFLGIILGDLTMAGIFTIVGFIAKKGYSIMPL